MKTSFITVIGAVVILALASCADSGLQGTISYIDPDTGASGGLIFTPDNPTSGFLDIPMIDAETGKSTGGIVLEVPIIDATK